MRRAGWMVLSLMLAAVTAVSILHVPQANRLSAVPAHAKLVYNSESPDWFVSFFPILGTLLHRDAQSFPGIGKNDGVDLQGLENRPLVVATVPSGVPQPHNRWVAVSELDGAAALALRWRLLLLPPDGVSVARPYAVWPVWRFEHTSLPSWAKVRFALTESLLIVSVSADSRDIYRLLDTADGRARSSNFVPKSEKH